MKQTNAAEGKSRIQVLRGVDGRRFIDSESWTYGFSQTNASINLLEYCLHYHSNRLKSFTGNSWWTYFSTSDPKSCLPQHSWTPNDDMSHKVNLLAFLHPSCSMHYGEQRAYQEATTASTCRLCLSQWRRGCTNNACIGPWISRHHQSAWSSRLQRWRGKRQAGGHPIPVNSNATSTIEKRCCRTDIGQPYRRPWMLARSFITPFCSTASTIAPHYTHQPKPTLLLPLNNALNCCHHFTHIHGAIRKVDSSVTIISMSRQNSHLASFRRAVRRKSLISWICFGCNGTQWKAAEIAHQANLLEPQFSTSERRVRGTHHGVCYTDFLL